MTGHTPAGTYELQSFIVQSFPSGGNTVDLKAIVHTWSITESILSGSVRGKAKIYDSTGVLYSLPIRCQEKIVISYKDFKGVEREETMFLYSITDIRPASRVDDNTVEYTIHFCSWGKFWSDRHSIRRCIAEGEGGGRVYLPVSEQAQILFDDYYADEGGTEKEIEIHETEGEMPIIIPAMKPEDAMHLFSRKAHSGEFRSNMYRFFESREQYYFVNLEELLQFVPDQSDQFFFYSTGDSDQTPEGELLKMQNIISFDLGMVDTLDALNGGAYNRKLEEIDIMNRRLQVYEYTHLDEYQNLQYPDSSIRTQHTEDFINQHMDKWHHTYVIKDYPEDEMQNAPGLRPHTYYGDIYNFKNANIYQYNQSKINITIFGTNEVFAGSFITLDLPQLRVEDERDGGKSGNYFVETVTNEFVENMYYQKLSLIKGGVRDVRNA
jgi:hypothetical protein